MATKKTSTRKKAAKKAAKKTSTKKKAAKKAATPRKARGAAKGAEKKTTKKAAKKTSTKKKAAKKPAKKTSTKKKAAKKPAKKTSTKKKAAKKTSTKKKAAKKTSTQKKAAKKPASARKARGAAKGAEKKTTAKTEKPAAAEAFSLGDTVKRLREVAWRLIEGEAVIVTPADSMMHSLNEVGTRIWELLDGKRSLADIAATLQSEFEVDEARAEEDAVWFAECLAKKGLVSAPGE